MKIRKTVLVMSLITLLFTSCKTSLHDNTKSVNKEPIKTSEQNKTIVTEGKAIVTEVKQEEKMIALKVEASNCKFKLLVNNKLVMDEVAHTSFVFFKGVEHHLVNGENKLEVILDQPENEASYFLAKIVLFDPEKEKSEWIVYKKIETNNKGSQTITKLFDLNDFKVKKRRKDLMFFIQGRNCKIETTINGISLEKRVLEDASTSISIPVDRYIVDGKNSVKISVIPMGQKASKIKIKLASIGDDTASFFDESSWDKHIVIEDPKILKEKMYVKIFNLKKEYKLRWETAPKIKLDKKTIKKIDAFMEKIHTAINNKKAVDIMPLFKYYYKDMKLINPKFEIDTWKNMDIEGLNTKNKPLIKLKKGNYKLVANDRLVACVGSDNFPLIRSKQDSNPIKEYMYIGLVDEEFYILLRQYKK